MNSRNQAEKFWDRTAYNYDGQKLYFASKRPKIKNGNQENDIWILDKTEQGWDKPRTINNLIGFWTPTVTRNGMIYIGLMQELLMI